MFYFTSLFILLLGIFKFISSFFNQGNQSQVNSTTKTINKLNDDLGKFRYDEDGFIFSFDDGSKKIRWVEINKLIAYKVDLMTVDEIRMDILCDTYQFTITEETPGWFQFVLKTKKVFPEINENWDLQIIKPAFEATVMVVYERIKNL